MDDLGNILIKRLTKSPVYAVNTSEENSLDHEIVKLQNGLLEFEKPFKLFDMKKFQQNVNRELKRQYPDRRLVQNIWLLHEKSSPYFKMIWLPIEVML